MDTPHRPYFLTVSKSSCQVKGAPPYLSQNDGGTTDMLLHQDDLDRRMELPGENPSDHKSRLGMG